MCICYVCVYTYVSVCHMRVSKTKKKQPKSYPKGLPFCPLLYNATITSFTAEKLKLNLFQSQHLTPRVNSFTINNSVN